jgi:hypothetical protein
VDFASNYLWRNAHHKEGIVPSMPDSNTSVIITIPCYREELVIATLNNLFSCFKPSSIVEVLILINYPEGNLDEEYFHLRLYREIQQWVSAHTSSSIIFYPIYMPLPPKEAGVGLARKVLMDEAVIRFSSINKPKGIIVGFDADCLSENNYLIEIEKFFFNNPHANGCSIYFEHPLYGAEYNQDIYNSIALYELYLRYYVEGLRYAGFPYAFHTLGSSFAVRADAYVKQGGMNKRKAGEDFYFLNKIMKLGNYFELNSTTVFPSPRISNRVPFGTGAAINKIIEGNDDYLYTFSSKIFDILKTFFNSFDLLYSGNITPSFHPVLEEYLKLNDWNSAITLAHNNSTNFSTFKKRMFNWFDGLKVLQFMHYAHFNGIHRMNIVEASYSLLQNENYLPDKEQQNMLYKQDEMVSSSSSITESMNHQNIKEMLLVYRKKQKSESFAI